MAPMIAARTGAAGLGTGVARWAMIFTWGAGVVQSILLGALDTGVGVWALAVASLLELIGVVMVTERSNAVLTPLKAAAVSAIAAAALLVGLVPPGVPGPWGADLPAFLAALLIARGSVRAGVVAGSLVVATLVVAGMLRGAEAWQIVASVGIPLIAVAFGSLWRIGLRVTVETEQAHRTAEARAAVALAASERAAREYRRQLHRIREEVAPLLERIAEADVLSPEELTELVVEEGAIRDRLRSPRVTDPALVAALGAARRRGVRVSMLWGEGPGDAPEPALLAEIARLVQRVGAGTVVIRAVEGQGGVSFVHNGPDGGTRVVLDDSGEVRAVS